MDDHKAWAAEKLRWVLERFAETLGDERVEVTYLVTADAELRQRAAEAIRGWL